MDYHADLNRCLRHFSNFIGAPSLVLNENNMCAFVYQDKWQVYLELPDKSPSVYLHAPIIEVPVESRLEFYEHALKLNAYGLLTRGAILAIDPKKPQILLCYLIPAQNLEETLFTNTMHNFIEILQKTHEQFQSVFLTKQRQAEVTENPDMQYWNNRI